MPRILVVRTDRMGDVVLATPLVRALRRTFPDAHLAALVRPYTQDLLQRNPHLDAVLADDREHRHAGRRGFWRLVGELRQHRFDTALLLLPTERAAWALFWAGIPRRIGVGRKLYEVVTGMRSVGRNKYVPLRHEADYCLDLGRRIGVRAGTAPEDLATEVFLDESERQAARARLRARGVRNGDTLAGIHPTSGGSSPNWPPERFLQLAEELQAADPALWIVVTGEDPSPAWPASERVVDLRGRRPLRELMADLSQLDVLVSASTGPMHVAAALGIPTVSLFCTLPACAPALWGPQGNRSRIVLPASGSCPGRCPPDPKTCRFEHIALSDVVRPVVEVLAEKKGLRVGGARSPGATDGPVGRPGFEAFPTRVDRPQSREPGTL